MAHRFYLQRNIDFCHAEIFGKSKNHISDDFRQMCSGSEEVAYHPLLTLTLSCSKKQKSARGKLVTPPKQLFAVSDISVEVTFPRGASVALETEYFVFGVFFI